MTYRYIYKITCTQGRFKDKFYFGQRTTTNLDDNYKGSGKLILKYYKKHPNDYVKEIISFHKTKDELNQAEYDIIKPWLGNPMCLNLKDGGEGGSFKGVNKGKKHSEETKRKISDANTGKHHSEDAKLKISKSSKNRRHSEETRKKISESHKGKHLSEEHKMKLFASFVGKHLSEEHKRKISESEKYRIPKNKGRHRIYNDINDKSKGYHYE